MQNLLRVIICCAQLSLSKVPEETGSIAIRSRGFMQVKFEDYVLYFLSRNCADQFFNFFFTNAAIEFAGLFASLLLNCLKTQLILLDKVITMLCLF